MLGVSIFYIEFGIRIELGGRFICHWGIPCTVKPDSNHYLMTSPIQVLWESENVDNNVNADGVLYYLIT